MFDTLQTFIAPRLRSFLKLLSIGHFHKKRIVFFSYFGAQYSCNPKYISEYMQERHPDFEIIWAFKSPQNFSYLHDKGIKTVKYLHPYFLHVCLTSKFIVTNSEIPAWFPIMVVEHTNVLALPIRKNPPENRSARKLHEKYLVHMYQVQTHLQN